MKKISLKKLNLKEVDQLTREQLKNVLGGSVSVTCLENEHYESLLDKCVCNSGYTFNYVFGKCVAYETEDPTPKITACIGKQEFDLCSWNYQGVPQTGQCRYRMASPLYCSDTIFT